MFILLFECLVLLALPSSIKAGPLVKRGASMDADAHCISSCQKRCTVKGFFKVNLGNAMHVFQIKFHTFCSPKEHANSHATHVECVHVFLFMHGIAQLHHKRTPCQKGYQHSSPVPTGLEKHCSCGWSLGGWGVNLFARFWGTLQNMFLYYFKVWFSCRLVSLLGVSNVETPCQKGLHDWTYCCYQWVPVGFQVNFNIGFPQCGLYFGRKKVKPTLNKRNRNIHKKSNLIKFDQIDFFETHP